MAKLSMAIMILLQSIYNREKSVLDISELNIWAVIVAWLINMFVGAFWYSPGGFAKQWTRYTGNDIMKIPQQEATQILGFVALSALVQAVTLALIIAATNAMTALDGVSVGLLLWFGLVSATTVGVTLYQRLSWKFLWLNSAYFLVVMSINSVILAIWR